MTRIFNVNGTCRPDLHYMVDLSSRLAAIKTMVDAGNYFTINRARQYGKTTTLTALANYLMPDYDVISLDFQGISSADFESERLFVAAFSRQVIFTAKFLSSEVGDELTAYATAREKDVTLSVLFMTLLRACSENNKKIVLLIDEVDSASNNQVFLDFLAQLRYLCTEPGKEFMRLKPHPARATDRGSTHSPYPICLMRSDIVTFQSVIFAGIYDVRNLKRKIHPDEDSKYNSPWNIAVDFTVDMGFSPEDIATMLRQYEDDWHTGMDIDAISQLLYDYTRGYPYLVTRLCQIMAESMTGCESAEEKIKCWNQEAFQNAVCELLKKPNTLFDDMSKKLADYPKLKEMIYSILFQGKKIFL
ncbi:MAG: AAA-like domain-containing protein [Lachnospiraceae bacterium]|nr:AAA-like domain-containing protein [Lachnospiraceae bacterium]